MSIQSANTSVLAGMKRKYSAQEVEFALNEIARRVPHAYVGMDVIAGFVGETDTDFEDTYMRLAGLPWTRMHVFPYSERPGTFALKLEGKVPSPILHRRAAQLRELSWNRVNAEASKQVGTIKRALILKNSSGGVGSAGMAGVVGVRARATRAEATAPTIAAVAREHWPIEIQLGSGSSSLTSDEPHSPGDLSRLSALSNLSNEREEVELVITGVRPRPAKQDVVLLAESV